MSWNDTDIVQDENGWWCGGQCWETENEAQRYQLRLTSPTQSPVTHDEIVIRHTHPVTTLAGLGYDMWFEVDGQRFEVLPEAMKKWKIQTKK